MIQCDVETGCIVKTTDQGGMKGEVHIPRNEDDMVCLNVYGGLQANVDLVFGTWERNILPNLPPCRHVK